MKHEKTFVMLLIGFILVSVIYVTATGYTIGQASHPTLYADIIRGKAADIVSVNDKLVVTYQGEYVGVGTDQNNPNIELKDTDGDGLMPYIDFSNDAATDFDMRLILAGNDVLRIDGGDLLVSGGVNTTELCLSGDCRTAWPAGGIGGGTPYDTTSLDNTVEDSPEQAALVSQGCVKRNNEAYTGNHWMACPSGSYLVAITDDAESAQDAFCCPVSGAGGGGGTVPTSCTDGQVAKFDSATSLWECADDVTGSGSPSCYIQYGNWALAFYGSTNVNPQPASQATCAPGYAINSGYAAVQVKYASGAYGFWGNQLYCTGNEADAPYPPTVYWYGTGGFNGNALWYSFSLSASYAGYCYRAYTQCCT